MSNKIFINVFSNIFKYYFNILLSLYLKQYLDLLQKYTVNTNSVSTTLHIFIECIKALVIVQVAGLCTKYL